MPFSSAAHTTSQPGILASIPSLARYLVFSLIDDASARAALTRLKEITDGDGIVVGIGDTLVRAFDAHIEGLRQFPSMVGAGVEAPSTVGALWVWLRGDDRGRLLHRSRDVQTILEDAFAVESIVDAFKYDIGRDLTGYEDGIENPSGDEALTTALASNRGLGLDGSSFVAVQQWRHDLRRFDALSSEQQDNAIGRRKSDNEELNDAPPSAHVKRTAQESFSPEAFVLRRSMPWADANANGLMFVAFGRSFDAFEAQLRRMLGEEDGIRDALFDFTRPLTGNYFWCPPLRAGRLDLSALGA